MDILKLVLEQTGGPAGLIILLLSLASNVALYLGKRKIAAITTAVIAGVQNYRDANTEAAVTSVTKGVEPAPTTDVAKFIEHQAVADGVEAQLHKLVKSVTEAS